MRLFRLLKNRVKLTQKLFEDAARHEINTPVINLRKEKLVPGHTKNFPEYLSTKLNKRFRAIKLGSTDHEIEGIVKYLRCYLEELIIDYPGILITGLPIASIEDFNYVTKVLGYKSLDVSSGRGYRTHLVDDVYVSSDEPQEIVIEPHNEMAYSAAFPGKIMFCCVKPAEDGGENPLVFNHDIMRDLDQNVSEKVIRKKVRYYANLHHETNQKRSASGQPNFTWQEVLQAKSEEEAEKHMSSEDMNWEWQPNGDLRTWHVLEALKAHPRTGEKIWINQLTTNHASYYQAYPQYSMPEYHDPWSLPYHCTYGDGEEFEEHVLDQVRTTIWNNAMSLKLGVGDILFMDNFLCQHSRMPFSGDRKYGVQILE